MSAPNTKLDHVPDDALKEIVAIQDRIKKLKTRRQSSERLHPLRQASLGWLHRRRAPQALCEKARSCCSRQVQTPDR